MTRFNELIQNERVLGIPVCSKEHYYLGSSKHSDRITHSTINHGKNRNSFKSIDSFTDFHKFLELSLGRKLS